MLLCDITTGSTASALYLGPQTLELVVSSKQILCYVVFFVFSWNEVRDKLQPLVFIHPARPRSLQLSQFVPRVNNSRSSLWSRASVSMCETFISLFYPCFAIVSSGGIITKMYFRRGKKTLKRFLRARRCRTSYGRFFLFLKPPAARR